MRYMLDTDICSYIVRRRNQALLATAQTRVRSGAEVAISAVTYAELRIGAERSGDAARHRTAVASFCERLSGVIPWDQEAADEYARVHTRLARAGTPVGQNDAMIGAHALAAGYILVSNNQRHFSRIDGLQCENWT